MKHKNSKAQNTKKHAKKLKKLIHNTKKHKTLKPQIQ